MPAMAHNNVAAFHDLLRRITTASTTGTGGPRPARILALCGAGLSAASGLATFRGSTAALWHTRDPMKLATPEAFAADPGLVWRFYAYRRHTALGAQPNAGHHALAALANSLPEGSFVCLTQNVDGLSPRANHPSGSLRKLHGSLFDLRCVGADHKGRARCDYVVQDDFSDPLCPALSTASTGVDETATASSGADLPHIPVSELPKCPQCHSLLRPAVVWFGEALDPVLMAGIDKWVAADTIDLMLVIGTSAEVYPAAGYIEEARRAGAVVATINLDAESTEGLAALDPGDFAFGGSAADLLPVLLEPVIGKLETR
jgi:NAD+-dependent protein deacetylase sirtuin 5